METKYFPMHQYHGLYININCGKHCPKTVLILVICVPYTYKESYAAKIVSDEYAKINMEYFAN